MHAHAVESALERVLGSKAFRRARRLRRFLEHVVREELAGGGARLKEYSVGVAVFERGADFDPRIDTIVRVEAIKVRERLDAYFQTEGATEPVRISIPKGSYRPVFTVREEQPDPILDDPEALYWQAKSLFLGFTPDAYRRAIKLLGRAVERWPSKANLHALLAEAFAGATCSDIGFLPPDEGVPLMERAARRALELDPDCGQAHLFRSLAYLRRSGQSAVAEAAKRALALAPNDSRLHHWAAVILLCGRNFGEALLHTRQATRLQPDLLVHNTFTAALLLAAGKRDAAMGHFRDILEIDPNAYSANLWLSRALFLGGRFDEARTCAGRAYAATGAAQALAVLGVAEAGAGNGLAADTIIAKLEEDAGAQYVRPTSIALIHLARGRMEAAVAKIAAARQEGDFALSWSKADPRWAPLRGRIGGL